MGSLRNPTAPTNTWKHCKICKRCPVSLFIVTSNIKKFKKTTLIFNFRISWAHRKRGRMKVGTPSSCLAILCILYLVHSQEEIFTSVWWVVASPNQCTMGKLWTLVSKQSESGQLWKIIFLLIFIQNKTLCVVLPFNVNTFPFFNSCVLFQQAK